MSITELIKAVGGDAVIQFQNLDTDMTNISTRKDGVSKVTFGTRAINATQVATDSHKVGLVVWFSRDAVNKALKEAAGI